MAEQFNIPFEEAKAIVDKYFETFPGIKRYINDCQLFVDTHGYIADMVGRARRFKYAGWKIQEHNDTYYETWFDRRSGLKKAKFDYGREVSGDLRAGTNHPIQGLAASMTKIGAIELYKAIQAEGLDAEIIEFIHDRSCRV